jgi:hypothetical protein
MGYTEYGIWTLPLNLDDPEHPKPGNPELFLKATASIQNPVFSPDGRWIAYTSAETQPPQAFVRPFLPNAPTTAGKWQVSNDGANVAFWSRASNELFYLSRAIGVWAVAYTTTADTFIASPPRPILEKFPTLGGPRN